MAKTLSNGQIAELLSEEGEAASGHLRQALKGAARKALMWPDEAEDVVRSGRSLTELPGIGPALARRIHEWLESPPAVKTPSVRQEFLTLTEARRILSRKPGWQKKLRGDLQMHTIGSDGSATVEEMAAAALQRGYQYIAVTDHTKGLSIANGMDERRLRDQGHQIEALNEEFRQGGVNFTVLRSAEVNLSTEGASDMDSSALADLDIVLGCFHSALRRREDQTDRYLAGIRNRDIQILGHPQTRVYNFREGLQADWPRIFGEAARLNKAVEIDGYGDRQDLRVSLLKIAKREGTRISLGTDAHHPSQLGFIELSLAAAAKAGIPADLILNFLPVEELRAWVGAVRAGGGRRRQKVVRPSSVAAVTRRK